MPTAERTYVVDLFRVRNFLFLTAIVLMNYTLTRPSPVDIVFLSVLAFAPFLPRQKVTGNFLVLFFLLLAWTTSFYASSINLLADSSGPATKIVTTSVKVAVGSELLKKTFVVILGICACYVVTSWRESHFRLFLKVYVFSCFLAAVTGIFGFLTQMELLTWDGRAKGFIDDPNMFAAFLVPGVLGCIFLLTQQVRGRLLVTIAMLVIVAAILFAFSRAAVGSLLVCGVGYIVYLNRRNLTKASLVFLAGLVVVVLVFSVAFFTIDNFQEKLFDRLTIAKDYDLGHGGRYNRYLLAVPIILENPLGIGILQVDHYFSEPVHNIFISSFLNYGWIAGIAWLLLVILSVRVGLHNYKRTRSPIAILLLFAFLSQILCASLHEGEHWRHMWLWIGVLWGFNLRNFPVLPVHPVSRPSGYRIAGASAAVGR